MVTFRPDTPLVQIQAWVQAKLRDGVVCPACGQHAKVYKRKVNAGMARSLIWMYQAGGTSFIHLPTAIGSRSREEGKLRYWGLVEERRTPRPDGGRAGFWRVTERGELFVLEKLQIPAYALVYNSHCLGLTGNLISIRQALGRGFSYSELMRT